MEIDSTLWAVLTGAVIPFISPLFSQWQWSAKKRQIFVLILSLVAGIINALISGEINSIPLVFGSVVAVYESLNKTGIFSKIEEATSITTVVDEAPTPPENYLAGGSDKELKSSMKTEE